jgi:hypothetical protein
LGGWIQLDIHAVGSIRITVAVSEDNAIQLADQLRSALSDPTLAPPSGENVVVFGVQAMREEA